MSSEELKIPDYRTYESNFSESLSDGFAIAIKYNIKHNFYNDFDTDFLAVELDTSLGPIMVATTYLPPRRPFLPYTDMHRLLSNARHTAFGNRDNNTVGKSLVNLINQGKMAHHGPHFPTFFSAIILQQTRIIFFFQINITIYIASVSRENSQRLITYLLFLNSQQRHSSMRKEKYIKYIRLTGIYSNIYLTRKLM